MKKYSPKEILKLAAYQEYKVNSIKKTAWWQIALAVVPLLSAGVSAIVDTARSSSDINEDIDLIISNLSSYKESYGFGPYNQEFENFIKKIKELKVKQAQISKIDVKSFNESSLSAVQEFISLSDQVSTLGSGIIQRLNELKGFGSKVYDVVDVVGLTLGIPTATKDAQKFIGSLITHLESLTAPLRAQLMELQNKMEQAQAEQSEKSGEAPQTEISTEDSEEPSEKPSGGSSSEKITLDPALLSELAEIGQSIK